MNHGLRQACSAPGGCLELAKGRNSAAQLLFFFTFAWEVHPQEFGKQDSSCLRENPGC